MTSSKAKEKTIKIMQIWNDLLKVTKILILEDSMQHVSLHYTEICILKNIFV